MPEDQNDALQVSRRQLLKGALIGSVAASANMPLIVPAQTTAATTERTPQNQEEPKGYAFLTPAEAVFVEAIAEHMVPADTLTPGGIALGIPVYIDRALAGSWGRGDRIYMEGPWAVGTPMQGYQLPLAPAELYRAGIAATDDYCANTFGKTFELLSAALKESVLSDLSAGKIEFKTGLPSRAFFTVLYQTVVEGMFADPIYGGNAEKAGWKMLGFPGVIATHALDMKKFKNKKYTGATLSIADAS